MKITRRQLRRLIRESMKDDYRRMGNFDPDSREMHAAPEGGYKPLESFKIPYKNYGYEGRKIITRDRAWLEFVPKGSPPMTKEDMFRTVTLLDSDDLEIGLAMATVHAPKSAGPVESYDVYSVYATTTG